MSTLHVLAIIAALSSEPHLEFREINKFINREQQLRVEAVTMFGILKFQTFLLVVLLFICSCTYLHGVFPAWLDRNKSG